MLHLKKIGLALGIISVISFIAWIGYPLFFDQVVDEPILEIETDRVENTTEKIATQTEMPTSSEAVASSETVTESEAITEGMEAAKLYTGTFRDGVKKYKTSGSVQTLIVDEKVFLRFEDFETTNGPDLFVYLVMPGTETKEGINLGALKGNIGNQNYEVPLDVDLSQYQTVVIWCKAFDSDFGYADLE